MKGITPNFNIADDCLAFTITSKILDETLEKAKSEGREYAWEFLSENYWLPEKSSFDYELNCPIFGIHFHQNSIRTFIHIENSPSYDDVFFFISCYRTHGELNKSEWILISKMVSYLRYSERDFVRKIDIYWWNQFSSRNVISNETVLIWSEDKSIANSWAQKNFSYNKSNALIGKCGEFVFSYWAGECGLKTISQVDLNDHPEGDEYDFLAYSFLVTGKNNLKIDIKTFQIQKEKKRDWWNISSYCLQGRHEQDIFVFVIVDDDLRMGKVVGYLFAEDILNKGEEIVYQRDFDEFPSSYYKIHLQHINNPYFLRAFLDLREQIFSVAPKNNTPANVISQIVRNYPLDPISSFLQGKDWKKLQPSGEYNLAAKPTLQMFVSLDAVN